ncbi:hypothetical protein A6B43_02250 [Vespertiliibacter pulmonis]|uniref:MFS transporter n=1 Tax=Vespertiliibacter pulmonis TaxID=1443036 RepID=A0A3N4VTL2_9PAST|nr:MFS transporter [Vespertiliibacter pulmonis]QLB20447.1 hypothetical protein A6B43_02250 [Vespertiliibacter pulmonis]RPE86436.1 MFS transporter [Vespertiliibacter pulmonis]
MFRILISHSFFNLSRAFIGAVLIVYLLNNQITLTTIALAKSLQLFMSVVMNYPAGKISDRFGYKTAILISCLCSLIYFLLILNPTNITVLFGELFNGLSIAFYMGAYEAWIFEFKNKKENSFTLISRSAELFFISSIIASIIGGLYFNQALYFSILFMILAIICYIITPQNNPYSNRKIANILKSAFFTDLKSFCKKADTQLLFSIIFVGSMQIIYQYWAIFFAKNLNIENNYLGYILALMLSGQWLFSFLSRKFTFNLSKYAVLISLSGVFIFSLLNLLLFLTINHYNLLNKIIITLNFIIFVAFCGLTSNLFFAKSCDKFSHLNNQSSMISLIDMNSRIIGTILLTVSSLFNIEQIPFIFLIFNGIILVYLFSHFFLNKDSA